ncbi:MAG TPA: hypothetical protein VES19_03980 [Candidatus Limnocylindrales bacterium]|nr:hypothetical protein [Candidatus Limnocylindrales bacterium]
MIRNVVIHISNEQPLLADLFSVPSPADVGLVCTNVRMIDGKKPIFIDHTDSTFFFPNLHVRFLEISNVEMARHLATAGSMPGHAPGFTAAGGPGEAATLDPDQRLPIALGDGGVMIDSEPDSEPEADPDHEVELDIDEDFLQRIRDI